MKKKNVLVDEGWKAPAVTQKKRSQHSKSGGDGRRIKRRVTSDQNCGIFACSKRRNRQGLFYLRGGQGGSFSDTGGKSGGSWSVKSYSGLKQKKRGGEENRILRPTRPLTARLRKKQRSRGQSHSQREKSPGLADLVGRPNRERGRKSPNGPGSCQGFSGRKGETPGRPTSIPRKKFSRGICGKKG